jgi:hypothetical protein
LVHYKKVAKANNAQRIRERRAWHHGKGAEEEEEDEGGGRDPREEV